MKTKLFILSLLTLCVSLLIGAQTAYSEVSPYNAFVSRLDDGAELLTEQQRLLLVNELDKASRECGIDIVVVTRNGINGDIVAAADDYYDYNGYSPNGILLMYNIENDEGYFSTAGTAISKFSDSVINTLGKEVRGHLNCGDYYNAFATFAVSCSEIMLGTYSKQATESLGNFEKALIALAIGFVIALIATLVMKAQLKTVRPQQAASQYYIQNSLDITNSTELYLYSNVIKTPKPEPKSSSGTHVSSSGRSHGGGRF